jgi:membrane protein implicated in regulation of membrane protease activity
MNSFINALVGNPILFTVAVIVSIFIILAFAKRIIRLALVLLAAAVLYAAWLTWHGQSVTEKAEKAQRTAKEAVKKGERAVKYVDGLRKLGDEEPGKRDK